MTEPPPAVTTKATVIPGTPFPLTSTTRAWGATATRLSTKAVWPLPAAGITDAGVPGTIWMGLEISVGRASESTVNRRVSGPAVPMMTSPVKVAVPVESVTALTVPAVDLATNEVVTARMASPARGTPFPKLSRIWITGCGANGAPAGVVAGGGVTKASCAGAAETFVTWKIAFRPGPGTSARIWDVPVVVPRV